jgi:type IV secretion system protein TrbL
MCVSVEAWAQIPTDNILDGVIIRFRDAANTWRGTLSGAAQYLFWSLVTIDLVWNGIEILLKRSSFDDVKADIVRRVLVISFYLGLLQYAGTWTTAIVDSFRQIGQNASTAVSGVASGINPSDIFDSGLSIALRVMDSASVLSVSESILVGFTSLIILVCYAFVAAFMLIALIEMYVALSAGSIILGFGGSRITADYVNKYFTYVVSVGMKLFSLQLLVGIAQAFVLDWYQNFQNKNSQAFVLIGVAIVFAVLVITIPSKIQGLVTGANLQGGSPQNLVSVGAQIAGASKGGFLQTAGAAFAAYEGAKHANTHDTNAAKVAGFAKNMAMGGIADIGARFAGVPGSDRGVAGARIASRLRADRLKKSAETQRTDPAADNPPQTRDTIRPAQQPRINDNKPKQSDSTDTGKKE